MSSLDKQANSGSLLSNLLAYLELDPQNLNLLTDTANAAFDEGDLPQASLLIERCEGLAPLTPALANLRGLIALGERRFVDAAAIFESLRQLSADGAALAYNLAFARSAAGDYEAALAVLDETTLASGPHAAVLKIQTLHHLDRLSQALAAGEQLTGAYLENRGVLAALGLVALDADEPALADAYARGAGDHPDALLVLGSLAIQNGDTQAGLRLLDEALSIKPNAPRALFAKGMALVTQGEADTAAKALRQAASIYSNDPTSWLALGWAELLRQDRAAAYDAFESARRFGDASGEPVGAMALIDALEGRTEHARQHAEHSLGLDPENLPALVARGLLEGESPATAEKIRELILGQLTPEGAALLAKKGFPRKA